MENYSEKVSEEFPQYLNDEANIIVGHAERIYFPQTETDVIGILKIANLNNTQITISGGGTGLSGGRVPLGGWILATDDLTSISGDDVNDWIDPHSRKRFSYSLNESGLEARITLPPSIPISSVQRLVRQLGWFYPPDPTERSAFLGGTVATNASGSRSFKYGSTREWIQSIRVVLGNGEVLVLNRDPTSIVEKDSITITGSKNTYQVKRPSYYVPNTRKNVATPIITDQSHSLDLFIGSGGLFGVITEITLRLIRIPKTILNIFAYCPSHQSALELIKISQRQRRDQADPVPMSVEYLDLRAMDIIRLKEKSVSKRAKALIILEQDAVADNQQDEFITYWLNVFEQLGIQETSVAQTQKEIDRHKELRHSVPEYINSVVKSYGQSKYGSDFSVEENKLVDIFDVAISLGEELEAFQGGTKSKDKVGYAIWAHGGDCHLHLNFIPRSDEEGKLSKSLMFKFLKRIVELGGSIAAEHGLGKKEFEGKPAVFYSIGSKGIQEIQQMKKILDPNLILNPKNLIG